VLSSGKSPHSFEFCFSTLFEMGSQCSFVSPQLTTAVGGAAPTFAFDATNANYFALQGQFATGTVSSCLPIQKLC
jgi:hypothetical protein